MPVVSMSIRALIGIVQAFDTPGSLRASSSWLTSSSSEMRSDVNGRNAGFSHSGAHPEYQVSTRRHSDFGFSVMTVSSMESGAGSVLVSARPALPSTRSTSGNCFITRSVTCSSFCASEIEIPGIVVGM